MSVRTTMAGPRHLPASAGPLLVVLALAAGDRPAAGQTQAGPNDAALIEEIEAFDEQAARAHVESAALRRRIQLLEEKIAADRAAIAPVEDALSSRRDFLGRRLRALYRFSERSLIKLFFATTDHHDWMKRARYLWFVLSADATAVAAYRDLLAERTRLLADHQATRDALDRTLTERRTQEADAVAASTRRRDLLSRIRASGRAEVLAAHREQRASPQIERMLTSPLPAQATPPRATGFAAHRGRLVPPAVARATRGFGRYTPPGSTEVLLHKGIDLVAPEGTPIRAVYRGAVRQAGWMRGFGNLALLDHGEGWYTVYAHAREFVVSAGDSVETSQVIGTVGSTGSLQGPYLYFEIRHRGEPQDPATWLALPPGTGAPGPLSP